jgi:uncharacterized membrane protein YkvA (DUF1232 family)
MTNAHTHARFIELFPDWLETLGADASALAKVVAAESAPDARRILIAGLNYIFKSLDLIPDGIDDLGFLDDAFVLRVAARHGHDYGNNDEIVIRLAEESQAVQEFLGGDYPRLDTYVSSLLRGAARGRSVDDIMADEALRSSFLNEIEQWGTAYVQPTFNRDEKTLVKLRAFLSAKLP